MSPRQTESFLDPLLEWYEMNGRHDLPWREPERSAFQLLIAEILLQKTRAEAVTGAYVPLMARYPTPEAFVSAPIDEIEGRISSLGLSKRAAYIRRCSGQLLARHGGTVPRTRSELLDLHGVGEYTARSVLIHTGREGISAVDSNVERLLPRFFGFDPAIETSRVQSTNSHRRSGVAIFCTGCSTSRPKCAPRAHPGAVIAR